MSDSQDRVISMYEGALRAVDTKAQIFLAFLTITIAPVFGRLAELEAPSPIRIFEGVLFGLTAIMFVVCLYPRRGKAPTLVLFSLSRSGEEVGAHVTAPDFVPDRAGTLAVLHDIYRVKVRSVTAGIVFLTAYVLTAALALALL